MLLLWIKTRKLRVILQILILQCFLVVVLLILLWSVSSQAAGGGQADKLDPDQRAYYVQMLAGQKSAVIDAVKRSGGRVTHDLASVSAIAVLLPEPALAGLRRASALPTRIQIAARPGAADEVARRLEAGRHNGVMVDLVCTPENKVARLGEIAALGTLIDDFDVIPPSLDDIYNHFSRRDGQ